MFQRKKMILYLVLTILAFQGFASEKSISNVGNDTVNNGLSQDELILFNMINDIRLQNKLTFIPLSQDLCTVAKTHIDDLIKWKPQDKGCSLHSWSGSGKWTSCCNTKEVFGIQCMKSKPREITGYAGDGYELIYWGEENATPEEAASLWRDVDASLNMILSHDKWSNYQWKAIGVGIKNGYAVLWLGDTISAKTDHKAIVSKNASQQPKTKVADVKKTVVLEKNTASSEVAAKPKTSHPNIQIEKETKGEENSKPSINETGKKYYLIVGSLKTPEDANIELKKIKSKGFPDAFIVEGGIYRIAISSYDAINKAAKRKNELKDTFPGIWVYTK